MVHAQNISGWSLYSNASLAVSTPREDAIPLHAVRLEAALDTQKAVSGAAGSALGGAMAGGATAGATSGAATGAEGSGAPPASVMGILGAGLVEDIAGALGMAPRVRLLFRWAYGGATTTRVVFDVLPDPNAPLDDPSTAAAPIADAGPSSAAAAALASRKAITLPPSPSELAYKLSGLMSAHSSHLFVTREGNPTTSKL